MWKNGIGDSESTCGGLGRVATIVSTDQLPSVAATFMAVSKKNKKYLQSHSTELDLPSFLLLLASASAAILNNAPR